MPRAKEDSPAFRTRLGSSLFWPRSALHALPETARREPGRCAGCTSRSHGPPRAATDRRAGHRFGFARRLPARWDRPWGGAPAGSERSSLRLLALPTRRSAGNNSSETPWEFATNQVLKSVLHRTNQGMRRNSRLRAHEELTHPLINKTMVQNADPIRFGGRVQSPKPLCGRKLLMPEDGKAPIKLIGRVAVFQCVNGRECWHDDNLGVVTNPSLCRGKPGGGGNSFKSSP